ncbi:hypothetical protein [Mesorhizobium sp. WSM4313]|uniref:hypothetical protein n=1 Tax=Mesorhizobium sp. WSM4313 TaxID=2029412 RepID=UPI000BAF03CF|nr:hypothetical protein [Mesorhizobium sp. WSM4313]PBB16544.1 hypothetical protein CK219_28695 [Mesorhizobium sp. WSM4313]
MKALCIAGLRLVGGVLIVAAVLQWATFDYPDINPFAPGAILAAGMLSQLFNWILVCLLGTTGVVLIGFGRSWRQQKRGR